ncbi:Mitochondrial folate transporter/carrier-like isoform X2 [Oopsacas minuta]|uniref:Mitochondrial folate transporter/carrier-like isoform X2 n=1 Tax=Oopsacas minuta TaxID=111878 RepID=A0AAV7JPW4_9METZ|nr:Mitochondrial folate transporter/carrier-like isoform X2 [Oopsacas minuta]
MNDKNITSTIAKPTNRSIPHLIGGFSGGIIATFTLHPFEVLKTRLAVNDGSNSRIIHHKYTGLSNALQVIYRTSGMKGFYQGVTPNLIGSSISWGVFLYLYDILKFSLANGEEITMKHQLLSACLSGVTTLSITNPIWVVKTRMILQSTQYTDTYYYRNVFDGLNKIWRNEGIFGLYRGYIAGVIGVSHGVVQIVSYDRLKTIYKQYNNNNNINIPWYVYISLSAVSKVLAVIPTYPYQVIRFRIQSKNDLYRGIIQTTVMTARNEGVRGFYKGMLPSILRVTPATCITMFVYEYTLLLHRYLCE